MGTALGDFDVVLPNSALRVLSLLEAAGYEAWVVGGWVRDALLGSSIHDVDITTSAHWQQSAECLQAAGITVHLTGTAHGTITAVVENDPIEITSYRIEGSYLDHRHPSEVRFVQNVEEDLARRDFTVNAMAYHPQRGLLDLFGGQKDLEHQVIRCVGEPQKRFEEDALRMLRAVRFACRLGFSIDGPTEAAFHSCLPTLAEVAQERIGQELDGIVNSGRLAWALMHQSEVMCTALPELSPLYGFDQKSPYHSYDVYEHTARVCRAVEEFTGGLASSALRWSALLHDIAKPACFSQDETGRGHFYGHPQEGAIISTRLMKRLALPSALVQTTRTLVLLHDRALAPSERSVRRLLMRIGKEYPPASIGLAFELIDLKRADALAKVRSAAAYAIELDQVSELLRNEMRRGPLYRVSDLAISGKDVMAELSLTPGPLVGEHLSALLVKVMDGSLKNTPEDLLAELHRHGDTV